MGVTFETFMPTNAVFVGLFVFKPYDITIYVERIALPPVFVPERKLVKADNRQGSSFSLVQKLGAEQPLILSRVLAQAGNLSLGRWPCTIGKTIQTTLKWTKCNSLIDTEAPLKHSPRKH